MSSRAQLLATVERQLGARGLSAATIVLQPTHTIVPPSLEALEISVEVMAPVMGRRIELHEAIGEGGMGVVRLGTQTSLKRAVAVKALRPDQQGHRQTLKLLREAWITGALEHPNVVPVYDIDHDDRGDPLIVLKRIEGVEWLHLMQDEKTVARRFKMGLLEWNLSILSQVCHAVRFAHSRGIVHRDLKPENVMIGEFGEVYVLDWGIAVSMEDDHDGRFPLVRDANELAGTPAYMAPEMLGDQPEAIGPRTDVYLLGAILCEIATGRPPHEGETLMAMISSVALSNPDLKGVHEELARIIRRAMDYDPEGRFETVEQLRLAVQGFLEHRGSRQLAARAGERLEELLSLLNESEGEMDPELRQAIYHLFGECRFGFQQALDAWAENEDARRDLRRAVEAMARHELRYGDSRAAAYLLRELPQAPPMLAADVERAQKEKADRQLELEQLQKRYDPQIGRRTRALATAIFGLAWTAASILSQHLDLGTLLPYDGHLIGIGFSALLLLGGVVFGLWARETLMKTVINRNLALTFGLVMLSQVVLQLGDWIAGIDDRESMTHLFLLWALGSAILGISTDRRVLVAAMAYAAGFVVTSWRPGWMYYAMTVCHLTLTANLLIAWWRPRDLEGVDREQQKVVERATRREESLKKLVETQTFRLPAWDEEAEEDEGEGGEGGSP